MENGVVVDTLDKVLSLELCLVSWNHRLYIQNKFISTLFCLATLMFSLISFLWREIGLREDVCHISPPLHCTASYRRRFYYYTVGVVFSTVQTRQKIVMTATLPKVSFWMFISVPISPMIPNPRQTVKSLCDTPTKANWSIIHDYN
jgi:hypothetical protein